MHVMGSTSKNSIKSDFEALILWPRSLSMGINGVFGSGREEKGQSFSPSLKRMKLHQKEQ